MIVGHEVLTFDWHDEPTFSGRYINFFSILSAIKKKGIAFGSFDIAFLLSDPQYHLSLAVDLLLKSSRRKKVY